MKKEEIVDIKLERLTEQINELREVLNEICIQSDGAEVGKEMLVISQYLDELIVEYMNHVGADNNDD